jgi:hypothetical protein
MDKEQQTEWRRLREVAVSTLRSGDYLKNHSGLLVAQILFLPSFQSCKSWNFFRRPEKGTLPPDHFVLLALWNREIDFQKFRTPTERLKYPLKIQPTIEISELEIESGVIAEWLEKLSQVQIVAGVQSMPLGVDGTSYEVALGTSPWAFSRIGWWEQPPPEWQELGRVTNELMSYLEGAGEKSEAR